MKCRLCEMISGQQWLFLDSLVTVATDTEIANGGRSMQTASEFQFGMWIDSGIRAVVLDAFF